MTKRIPTWYEWHWQQSLPEIDDRQAARHDLVTVLLKKASIKKHIGQWAAEKALYENAISLARSLNAKPLLALCNLSLGGYFRNVGHYQEALERLTIAHNMYQDMSDIEGVGRALDHLGVLHLRQSRNEMALECFQKMNEIARTYNDQPGIVRALNHMGNYYKNQGDYDQAMSCYRQALTIAKSLNDLHSISFLIGNMGLIYKNIGNDEKAMKSYEYYLTIARKVGDKRGINFAMGNIGNLYKNQGHYQKAMTYFQSCLATAQELGSTFSISAALGNMGSVCTNIGDFERAREFYQRQLTLVQGLDDKKNIGIAQGNLGLLYQKTGDFQQALACLDLAIADHEDIGFKYGLTHWYLGKADVLYANKQYEDARIYAEKCVDLSRELSKPDTLFLGQVSAVHIAFALDDANKALTSLLRMLSETNDNDQKAELHYVLWRALILHANNLQNRNDAIGRYCTPDNKQKHRQTALEYYQMLYEKSPLYEYKQRIEELRIGNDE